MRRLQMGKSPMNVGVLLGVGEGQGGMAGTDRAPVLLLPARRFVTDGESSAVARHATLIRDPDPRKHEVLMCP